VKAENFTASPTDNKLVMQTVEEDNIPGVSEDPQNIAAVITRLA
jgi:hypothetical protein